MVVLKNMVGGGEEEGYMSKSEEMIHKFMVIYTINFPESYEDFMAMCKCLRDNVKKSRTLSFTYNVRESLCMCRTRNGKMP